MAAQDPCMHEAEPLAIQSIQSGECLLHVSAVQDVGIPAAVLTGRNGPASSARGPMPPLPLNRLARLSAHLLTGMHIGGCRLHDISLIGLWYGKHMRLYIQPGPNADSPQT